MLSDARGESLRNVTQNSIQTYYQFQDLEPWTNYSVKVTAFTSKGNGPYSASVLASTEEDGKLNNLIILKIMCLRFLLMIEFVSAIVTRFK